MKTMFPSVKLCFLYTTFAFQKVKTLFLTKAFSIVKVIGIKMNHSTKSKGEQADQPIKPDPSSNIWGWKFSLISLGIILFMIAVAAYRHWQLGIPFDLKTLMETPLQDSTEMQRDTFLKDTLR